MIAKNVCNRKGKGRESKLAAKRFYVETSLCEQFTDDWVGTSAGALGCTIPRLSPGCLGRVRGGCRATRSALPTSLIIRGGGPLLRTGAAGVQTGNETTKSNLPVSAYPTVSCQYPVTVIGDFNNVTMCHPKSSVKAISAPCTQRERVARRGIIGPRRGLLRPHLLPATHGRLVNR